MIPCAAALEEAGADGFGVAEAVEGIDLRKSGIRAPILVLAGILPEVIPVLFEYRLTPALVDGSCLELLAREADRRDAHISVHLKVDAGMGRQGCRLAEVAGLVRRIADLPGLELGGIMAHFPMADDPDSESSDEITRVFLDQLGSCRDVLPRKLVLHLANSGGILYFPGSHQDMVRPGISLYGCYPDGGQGRDRAEEPRLQPVMRFSTRVIQVRELPANTGLGYGHIFTTTRPSRIALVPAGYEDGYLRCLSNRAQALVHGVRVPSVGRISMNLTMFDVTDVDGVRAGDELVLLGRQGDEEIGADEVAGWMETINYEVLCLFGNLNRRVFREQGSR
jgi:alanine racemase